LQSQVTQLNSDLGNTAKYLRTDNNDNAAKTLWPNINSSSSYDFTWIPETAGGITSGEQARVIGFYNNGKYESQMILSYLSKVPVAQREKIDGSWGGWKVFVTTSDLDIFAKFYQTNELKAVTFQLYRTSSSDNKYILQVILDTNIFTKTINLVEFTI
jgi:hypothetical protein